VKPTAITAHTGDMALAFALHNIETSQVARLTNYAEYLEKASAHAGSQDHRQYIVELRSRNRALAQRLRLQFRGACRMEPAVESALAAGLRLATRYRSNPLRIRGQKNSSKIPVKRGMPISTWCSTGHGENIMRFMTTQAKRELSPAEIVTGLKLLELQRYLMLMYTSCGWFFDDLSGIETVQVIQYAGRALQLAGQLFSEDLSTPFLELLAKARSNLPEQGDGRSIYERYVQPAMVDLEKGRGHYAVSSLFEEYGQNTRIYCYDVEKMDYRASRHGKLRAVLGQASITSEITWESDQVTFGVLYLADHSVIGGVAKISGQRGLPHARPGARPCVAERRSGRTGADDRQELQVPAPTPCAFFSAMSREKILGIILEEATNEGPRHVSQFSRRACAPDPLRDRPGGPPAQALPAGGGLHAEFGPARRLFGGRSGP
jgi:hypothetical protein